jgi:hypothetical protein
MPWSSILLDDEQPDTPLRERVARLFAQQRATWPTLQTGEATLEQLQRKKLTCDGLSILVQVNPGRKRSTLAQTDVQSVAARPCFLCPVNMPVEERGVAFEDLVILPNPYPILPLHCTIASQTHQPQQLAGRVECFLRLAQELSPDLAALYNGPRCGASAPDHLHFQAALAAQIPLLSQLPEASGQIITPFRSFGRNLFLVTAADIAAVAAEVERVLGTWQSLAGSTEEPLVNLLAHYRDKTWVVLVFPRAKHRPACYFAEGKDQLLVSPAILEMCGILVTTEMAHFERLDAVTAHTIYEQVSIDSESYRNLIQSLQRGG